MQDGKLVGEWCFDQPRRPIEAMSATKSVVSLAIGKLVDSMDDFARLVLGLAGPAR